MCNTTDLTVYNEKLIFAHEKNILTKIKGDYHQKGKVIEEHYQNTYFKMREKLLGLNFDENHKEDFSKATKIINEYYDTCLELSAEHGITHQSKFSSSFLEEISAYLFKDIPEVITGEFGIYTNGVYAGLMLNSDKQVSVITKDVDFCIGKKVELEIKDSGDPNTVLEIIVPIVAVEVKTYLDATMLREIRTTSGSIRTASPNARTYVLMGYKDLKDVHVVLARSDSAFTEWFALKESKDAPFDEGALYDYWKEISNVVLNVSNKNSVNPPGRLLNPKNEIVKGTENNQKEE